MRLIFLTFLLFFSPATLCSQIQSSSAFQPTATPCTIANPRLLTVPESSVEKPPEVVVNNLRGLDSDCDGISNADDNCLMVPSQNQHDSDGDGWGDPCDSINSDISVSFIASSQRVPIGRSVKLAIRIKNFGPLQARGVEINYPYPRGVRMVSIDTSAIDCDGAEGGLICDIPSIDVGKSMSVTFWVKASKLGRARSTVRVENGIGDLNRGNNHALVDLMIVR